MLSRDMLARCQNSSMQAFCALDKDVQDAINANKKHQECLYYVCGKTKWKSDDDVTPTPNYVYRLSPDTPTEAEWEEREVYVTSLFGFATVDICGCPFSLSNAVCHKDFLGIIYVKDGVETLRTSVDAAFGKPVRVRFAKV